MADVGTRYLKGQSLRRISKEMELPYATTKEYIESWKTSLSHGDYAALKAQDAVFEADNHYALIKQEAWEIAEKAGNDGDLKGQTGALKLAMDSETRRVDMLHKAGMLENAELAQQMLETERKQEILANIIRNIVCPNCRAAAAKELAKFSGNVETIG